VRYAFSASQLAVYELCARKWAWTYIEEVEGEPNKWAEFGSQTHRHIEKWLRDREAPPDTAEGRVALAIIPHLPPPQAIDKQNVERGIEFALADVYLEGFVDLYMPLGPNGVPRVYDHKTTGDMQWALTPERMPDDIQVTVYAAWALIRSNAERVEVQWTYGVTRGTPEGHPVIRSVTGREIEPRLLQTIALAREAKLIRETPGVRALDVPYNPNACEHYGGCPFRQLCNLTPQERMRAAMNQATQKDKFLAELAARKNGQPVSQPINPPPAAAAAVAAVQSTPGGALERLRARKAAEAAQQQAPAAVAEVSAVSQAPQEQVAPVDAGEVAEAAAATRSPGRPKKTAEPVGKLPRVQWSEFAGGALGAMIAAGQMSPLDDDEREAMIALASKFADRMMAEQDARYGG
jgi:hypothetical protein